MVVADCISLTVAANGSSSCVHCQQKHDFRTLVRCGVRTQPNYVAQTDSVTVERHYCTLASHRAAGPRTLLLHRDIRLPHNPKN